MSTKPLSASPESQLAPRKTAVDYLYNDIIRADPDVCDNCFGIRDRGDEYFRQWGGGSEALRDRFCACGSGSGMPPIVEPRSGHDTRTRGGEGTVNRRWADGSLPIRDPNGLSEQELLANIIAYLHKTTEYDVDPDVRETLAVMAKTSRNYPRKNELVLKVGAWMALTDSAQRQVRIDAVT